MLPSKSSHIKAVYNPKAFILHAVSQRQTFVHCALFLVAASRRSRGRVSVPAWLFILSDQLPIIALVSHYLTNKLIRRRPFPKRINALLRRDYAVLIHLSVGYSSLWGTFLRVTHSSAARVLPHHAQLIKHSVEALPLDLHTLGTPPAFILSQDQTLQKESEYSDFVRPFSKK